MTHSTCSVTDCERVLGNGSARGYCNTHYARWRTYGDTNPRRSYLRPTGERLLSKIRINTETGCWEWTGYLNHTGYGHLRVGNRMIGAHRLSYTEFVGEIPDGLHLDHLCRVRHCINPKHLEPVTCRENVLRGEAPAAKQAKQTHCFRGHEFTEENTRLQGRKRHCIACKDINNAARAIEKSQR